MTEADKPAFMLLFSMLCERFGKTPSKPLLAAYWVYLSARLDGAAYKTAAAKLFVSATFFPAPLEFVTAANGKPEELARRDWLQIMAAMRHGGQPLISDMGKACLKQLGGMSAIGATDYSALRWLEADFRAAYTLEFNASGELELTQGEIAQQLEILMEDSQNAKKGA